MEYILNIEGTSLYLEYLDVETLTATFGNQTTAYIFSNLFEAQLFIFNNDEFLPPIVYFNLKPVSLNSPLINP